MRNNPFRNTDFTKTVHINSPKIPNSILEETPASKAIDNITKAVQSHDNEIRERQNLADQSHRAQIESIDILKNIESNTAYLQDIVSLLSISADNQKETKELVLEILSIAEISGKEEKKTIYRKCLGKINSSIKDVETMQKLVKLLVGVYGIAKSICN